MKKKGRSNKQTEYIWDRETQIKKIQRLSLFSNTFLSVTLDDVGACQHVLRVLLQDEMIELKCVKTQYTLLKLASRDACLDVLAEGKDGTLYGMEVQNKNVVDHPRRVRFYDAMIDSELLQKGTEYRELAELYFIYICRKDFMETGASAEEVERTWRRTKQPYKDGLHIVFVNAQTEDQSKTAELMKYFLTADPNDMSQGELSERVRFLKTDERGLKIMCEYSDELWRAGEAYGRRIGEMLGEQRGERRGERRGVRRGKEHMIRQYIRANEEMGYSTVDILGNLQKFFALSAEQAQKYMRKLS